VPVFASRGKDGIPPALGQAWQNQMASQSLTRSQTSANAAEDTVEPECKLSIAPSNDAGGSNDGKIIDANTMNGSVCKQIAQPNACSDAMPPPSSKNCGDHANVKTAENIDLVVEKVSNKARVPGSKAEQNAQRHLRIAARDSKYPALPAEGFPPNWELRLIPRQNPGKGPSADKLWYSPIMKYRFRSKKEVKNYLECLKSVNGDEVKAIFMFYGCGSEETCDGITFDTPSVVESTMHMKASPLKVIEFIEPSRLFMREEEERGDENKHAKHVSGKNAGWDADIVSPVYPKPIIKKGEKVYACWRGSNGLGRDWYPGRVWDVKEFPMGKYGPQRKYDVVYDDGDTESNMHEIWVMKKDEYELSIKKPEDQWIGVTGVTFPKSKDEYARLIGWYRLTCDGADQVYSSLEDALRSHDKVRSFRIIMMSLQHLLTSECAQQYIIDTKGRDHISVNDLNFPEEHGVI
jgi:hypothetical protein